MRLILETWWYISIFLHFSTLSWCRLLKSFLVESKDPFILLGHHHCCCHLTPFLHHFSGHHPVGVRLPHLPVVVSVLQQCGSQWIARPASYNRWGSSAWPMKWFTLFVIPPTSTKLKGGILVSPCPSVRLSVCGQNRVRSVSSTILVGSISYLHILSSNLRRCVACNVCFKI